MLSCSISTLNLTQKGRHFGDDISNLYAGKIICQVWSKCHFVPMRPIDDNPTLIQIMTRYRTGGKSLFESVMDKFIVAFICVSQIGWVNVSVELHVQFLFVDGAKMGSFSLYSLSMDMFNLFHYMFVRGFCLFAFCCCIIYFAFVCLFFHMSAGISVSYL